VFDRERQSRRLFGKLQLLRAVIALPDRFAKYGFVDPEPVADAADEANKNSVTAVGLVAAWKGLNEGPMLDEVCDRIRELKAGGKTRPDASLGIIKKQEVANRLKEAGLECYGHNLESSRRFFPQTCTTHTFDDRLETIGYLKKAGIKICSGGIIGLGETAKTVAISRLNSRPSARMSCR